MQCAKLLCLLGVGLVFLAGCNRQNSSPNQPLPLPNPPLVADCEPGRTGGKISLPIASAPRTFNPVLALDSASDGIVRFLFRPLVAYDLARLEIVPALAQSWSVAEDQKTWTFKLREGLRWSDGAPLTADDVVFTWNRIMYDDKYNQLTPGLFSIGGRNFEVTKIDATTVRVVTPEVYAPLVQFFGIVPILPRHALETAVNQGKFLDTLGLNTPPDRLPASGPYRLKELDPRKAVTLERNPAYYAVDSKGTRLPYIDEVTFIVTGQGSEVATFMMGLADIVEVTRPEYSAMISQLVTNPVAKVIQPGAGSEREFVWFNLNTNLNGFGRPIVNPVKLKWFRETKFRQAISCAIDRDRIAREVYGGRAVPAFGFISQENPKWYNPAIAKFPYDPPRAKALLGEIGIQDRNNDGKMEDSAGNVIEFNLFSNSGNEFRTESARRIVDDLKAIGIQANFFEEEFPRLLQRVNETFDYESAFMGLGGGSIDPASQLNVLLSSADLHQWFPYQETPSTAWEARVDQLTLAQMGTTDFAARKKYFDEVQAILAEQLPMIYTVSPLYYALTRPTLANLRPSVHTSYRLSWNLEQLYWSEPTPAR